MIAADDLELLRAFRGDRIPMPSRLVSLILDLLSDSESSHEFLVEQLESDAHLNYGFLTLANLQAPSARSFKSIHQALAHLGRNSAVSLLWTLTLSDQLQNDQLISGLTRDRLWRHSLLTGLLAELLFDHCGHSESRLALMAGMAHDLGSVLVESPIARLSVVRAPSGALDVGRTATQQHLPDSSDHGPCSSPGTEAPGRWNSSRDEECGEDELPFPAVRQSRPGDEPAADRHDRIGATLLSLWHAPESLVATARWHHTCKRVPALWRSLVTGVRLADLVAEYLEAEHPPHPFHLAGLPEWELLTEYPPWSKIPRLERLLLECTGEALDRTDRLARLLVR